MLNKRTISVDFRFVTDIAGLAEAEIKEIVNNIPGMTCTNAEVIKEAPCENLEADWFPDAEFIIRAEIVLEGNADKLLKKLSEISEFQEVVS